MKKIVIGLIAIVTLALGVFIYVYAAAGDILWTTVVRFSANRDEAKDVAMDSTGIYVVGFDSILGATNTQWRIRKQNWSTGVYIWSTTSNPTSGGDAANGVAVDSTGIYVVGYDTGGARWRIEKRNLSTGSLIWSFVYDYTTGSYGTDEATDVAVDSTGVYIVGYSRLSQYDYQWRIQKRNLTTGSFIWQVLYNPSVYEDKATGVAVDATGVYIVGYDSILAYGQGEWRIQKRNLTTGALIWSKTTPLVYVGNCVANDVAVDGTGAYIGGFIRTTSSSPADYIWRIEKRNLTTGNIIWEKTSNPTGQDDYAWGIARNSTGVYIVGHQNVSAGDNKQWRIEKRDLTTGNLIWYKTDNPTATRDVAYRVAAGSTGIYIAGVSAGASYGPGVPDLDWRVQKRAP